MLKNKAKKTLLFTVTIKDCRVDYFTVGGHGGSGKDTSNTGVRITHLESGAVGRAVDTRSQGKNRQLAFERMANSKTFKSWHKLECSSRIGQQVDLEKRVDQAMSSQNLRIEVQDNRGNFKESQI